MLPGRILLLCSISSILWKFHFRYCCCCYSRYLHFLLFSLPAWYFVLKLVYSYSVILSSHRRLLSNAAKPKRNHSLIPGFRSVEVNNTWRKGISDTLLRPVSRCRRHRHEFIRILWRVPLRKFWGRYNRGWWAKPKCHRSQWWEKLLMNVS